MKVSDLKYERFSTEDATAKINEFTDRVKNAQTADDIVSVYDEYADLMREMSTYSALAYMRYTINTVDEFYSEEKKYYDETMPACSNAMVSFQTALLNSRFRSELEQKLSPVLFKMYEVNAKSMSPEIIDLLVEESKITTEYSDLMASMEFEFRGETMPRTLLMGYAKSDDRDTRRECYEALGKGLERHSEKLDDIFDRLVHVRDKMAKKMGYKDFVELGYYRMGRICYDRKMVENFRANILKDIVPVVSELRLNNAKKLGIKDTFMLYDNDVVNAGGDPKPGDKNAIFAAAREMYHDMSEDTGRFIDMMLENDAFDVDSRKNKWGGGYCTGFPKFEQPFILANFNGTTGDVDVVTHEAGHAFADYMIKNNRFAVDINVGGMETAETHSMSMEFFAWKYMDKFFGEDAEKYEYMHAMDALAFIPYGTIVDYFQHIVYENPDMTPAERNAVWKKLEAQFRPWLSIEGIPYIENGTRWQYQMHIYESPFYYIDYVIAQVTAFQFLILSGEDYDDAFARYVRLLKQGGERLYTDLLAEAGIASPFEDGSLTRMIAGVKKILKDLE